MTGKLEVVCCVLVPDIDLEINESHSENNEVANDGEENEAERPEENSEQGEESEELSESEEADEERCSDSDEMMDQQL